MSAIRNLSASQCRLCSNGHAWQYLVNQTTIHDFLRQKNIIWKYHAPAEHLIQVVRGKESLDQFAKSSEPYWDNNVSIMKCCKPSWLKFQGFWTADHWRQWAATKSNLNRSHQIIYCYWEQIQVCPLDLLTRKIAINTATAVATSCTSWVHVRHILEGLAIIVCVNATRKSKVDEASS